MIRIPLLLLAVVAALAPVAPAHGSCSSANTYNYSFNWGSNQGLSYSSSYTFTASSTSGASQSFTTSFGTNGLNSSTVSNTQLPAVSNVLSGAAGGRTLVIGGSFSGRTSDITSNTRVIRVTFSFQTPIRDLTIKVHDIDYSANQYRDWLHIVGSNGSASYKPAMITPYGSSNVTGPYAASGSAVLLGPSTQGGVSASDSDRAVGIGASNNTGSSAGDITVSFAQPVTSVTLRYGNYALTSGENSTGQQAYGISAISFCPMPSLSMTKSSAPYATSGADRFNAPGSDVVYTLTVTNNGGSPVDLNGLVLTDTLPTNVTFYNGDFDTAASGTDPFQLGSGTSGVTLSSANVGYSSNDGASFAYVPVSGYDPAVDRVRFAPGGTMAANSSFTIKFRARIN